MDWGRSCLIVSGASRGLGAAICTQFAPLLKPGSIVIGFARNEEGLKKTENIVYDKNPGVKFLGFCFDLSGKSNDELCTWLKNAIVDERPFDNAIIVHNAASLGDLKYLDSITDDVKTQEYFNFNLSSIVSLNATCLEMLQGIVTKQTYVINISSLCAVLPVKSWGLYCAAKAARDMLFKVLALERTDINVLNYAPGPLDNDMQVQARETTGDPEVRAMFAGMKSDGKLLNEADSACKLIQVLQHKNYKSGDHVDYFDDMHPALERLDTFKEALLLKIKK